MNEHGLPASVVDMTRVICQSVFNADIRFVMLLQNHKSLKLLFRSSSRFYSNKLCRFLHQDKQLIFCIKRSSFHKCLNLSLKKSLFLGVEVQHLFRQVNYIMHIIIVLGALQF